MDMGMGSGSRTSHFNRLAFPPSLLLPLLLWPYPSTAYCAAHNIPSRAVAGPSSSFPSPADNIISFRVPPTSALAGSRPSTTTIPAGCHYGSFGTPAYLACPLATSHLQGRQRGLLLAHTCSWTSKHPTIGWPNLISQRSGCASKSI